VEAEAVAATKEEVVAAAGEGCCSSLVSVGQAIRVLGDAAA